MPDGDIIVRALDYYSKKAEASTTDPNTGAEVAGKDLFDSDIGKLDEKIELAKQEIHQAAGAQDFEQAIAEFQPLILDALTVYLHDLQASRQDFTRRLGGAFGTQL